MSDAINTIAPNTKVIAADGSTGIVANRSDGNGKIKHRPTDVWVRWNDGFSTWTDPAQLQAV